MGLCFFFQIYRTQLQFIFLTTCIHVNIKCTVKGDTNENKIICLQSQELKFDPTCL